MCCGTKRLSEIRCPDSCSYLAASRSHPPAVVHRQQVTDARLLAPFLRGLTDRQFAIFATLHRGIGLYRRSAIPPVSNIDAAEAAGALALTLETATRGIIYDQRPTSIPAERLLGEYRRILAELEQQRVPHLNPDAAVALRALEQGARQFAARPGARPSSFLELLDRVTAGAPAGDDASAEDGEKSAAPTPERATSRIVLP